MNYFLWKNMALEQNTFGNNTPLHNNKEQTNSSKSSDLFPTYNLKILKNNKKELRHFQ